MLKGRKPCLLFVRLRIPLCSNVLCKHPLNLWIYVLHFPIFVSRTCFYIIYTSLMFFPVYITLSILWQKEGNTCYIEGTWYIGGVFTFWDGVFIILRYWGELTLRYWEKPNYLVVTYFKSSRKNTNFSCDKSLIFFRTSLNHNIHRKLYFMILIAYILVGESTWCFSLDQLLLVKFFLCLVDLHVIKCVSLWILHIDLLIIMFCFLNDILCHTMLYTWYSCFLCMQVTSSREQVYILMRFLSFLVLFLDECIWVLCKIHYESLEGFM